MTSNLLTKLKTKFILALIIVGLFCTSLFLFSACSSDSETENEIPSYSYTETDDGLISNPTFNYNTSNIDLKNFPQTSPTGWSRSKDSSGISSTAKSGVIDISNDGWAAFLNNIYTDSAYLKYLETKLGFSKTDVEQEAKNENSSITADELKAKVVAKYKDVLTNDALLEGRQDNKVYALNNYTANIGIGASQRIISSNEISIEKGQYVAISVDVLTQNIKDANDNVILGMSGANDRNGDEYGASIRLVNSLNGTSHADYVIANINTDGEWKTYTIYAKADENFDCKVKLALGLGFSLDYPTEGTVYFDNITVTELETAPADLPTSYTLLKYGETKVEPVIAGETSKFFYNMELEIDDTYYKEITLSPSVVEGYLTKSSDNKTSADKGWSSTASFASNKVELQNASYTIKIDDATSFKVEKESYAYVSFKLNNQLSKFGSTTITVDVWEKSALGNKKIPAVTTVTETGETVAGLMIRNNFDKDDSSFVNVREFYIEVVVGPTNISSSEKLSDYASGSVTISDLKIATGKTYQYTDSTNETETENYKFYQLFNSVAKGSASLYAGYYSDFTESNESTASSGFDVTETYKVYLTKQLVAARDYDGVVPNHIYLSTKDDATSTINTRLEGFNGSYAGIVDTKYAYESGYNKPASMPVLDEDDMRALMIYNATNDAYGFIDNKEANTIAPNNYAKINVKVRVDGDAKAYIYLVDTTTKDVMTFDAFKPNTTGLASISSDKQVEVPAQPYSIKVTNTNEKWVDVTFYIATGKTEKSFRVELWNGTRDGETDLSQGYVFFKSVEVSLTASFTEPAKFSDSFINVASPLYGKESSFIGDNGEDFCYSRPLTDVEKEFNAEYTDKAISYLPKIVWAKTDNIIYSNLNNLDVEDVNPYDSIVSEEEDTGSGCTAKTDPATFWLSFSSILLAVVLILAIIMLFLKNIIRRRKARASDAKSHYTVKSRVRSVPKAKDDKNEKEEIIEETDAVEETNEAIEETLTETTEDVDTDTQENQPTLDDYVYGEVQDFGSENDETESNSSSTENE